MSKTAHSVTLLRTLVTVLFVCAIAALVLTALLGFEAPNDTLLHLSWVPLIAAILAVFAHLGLTTTLTPPQKRVWLRQLTGRTAASAWGAYLTCEDLRAAAIRLAEEGSVSNREEHELPPPGGNC